MTLLICESTAADAGPTTGRRAPPGRDGRFQCQSCSGGAGRAAPDAGCVQQLHRSELGYILGGVRAHGLLRGWQLEHEGEQIFHNDGPMAGIATEDGRHEGDGGDLHDVGKGGVALGDRGRFQRHRGQDRRTDGHELLILQLDGTDEKLDAFHEDREEPYRGADGFVHLLEVVGQLSRLVGSALGSFSTLFGGRGGSGGGSLVVAIVVLRLGPLALAGGNVRIGRP